ARADGKLVYRSLPVRHSRLVPTAQLGSSTGEPAQRFALPQAPVILETLVVEVDEGAGFQAWDRRDNLLYHTASDGTVTLSGPASPVYRVQPDEDGPAWVLFGDGRYGRGRAIGPGNTRATYRVGGGTRGNVPAGSIVDRKSPISRLASVTNEAPASGGADA